MADKEYDAIVIGAGSGGFTVAIGLTNFGKRVAVVEARWVGGDCTNVGCVPSKTLLHQAELYHGEGSTEPAFATVQRKRNALREKETEELQAIPNLDLIFGHARFLDPRRLEVELENGGTREIRGKKIVIATGSRPLMLNIEGLPAERTLTNESVFDLPEAPAHLLIVGSGPVGVEMATAFAALGSKVTLVSLSARVLSHTPPEASEALHRALTERGIDIHLNARADAYDEASQTLTIKRGDERIPIPGVDQVLIAAGRTLNVDSLGLERAGVDFDRKKGIPTDSYAQTNVPHIFAIGDVNPTSHYTHSANAQGRRATQRIAFPFLPAWSKEPLYPSAIYSNPEVATVGMLPDEIAERYHPRLIRRIRVEMSALDRGYTDGVEHGFVMVDAVRLTGRILGATIVGPHAADMISLFTLGITEGISLYKLYGIVYPYPSYSEGIKKVADEFMRATLPKLPGELWSYLRYRWASPTGKGAEQFTEIKVG